MDEQSNKGTKGLIKRLKYLKLWRTQYSPNNQRHSSNMDNRNTLNDTNTVVFRRNHTTTSLEEITQLGRSGERLRKSFRKWRRRMKNCFSKTGHVHERQTIHFSPAPETSTSLRVTLSRSSGNRENIYSLDPLSFQGRTRSPMSEQTSDSTITPSVSPSRYTPTENCLTPRLDGNVPKDEVSSLAHCVWYWGPASRAQVETKLAGAPDGSFLVRDSSSDSYIFSISFRSVGLTLHSRIEYTSRSGYKLFDHDGYSSVKELIEQAMEVSENGIYCYTKNRAHHLPNYPVRLTKPISRYEEVRSLQNLSRFVIRQFVNLNNIDQLSLPVALKSYLKEETIY